MRRLSACDILCTGGLAMLDSVACAVSRASVRVHEREKLLFMGNILRKVWNLLCQCVYVVSLQKL